MKELLIAFLISYLIASDLFGQSVSEETLQYAHESAQTFAKDYPGLTITVFKENQIAFQMAFGNKDISKKEPVDNNTLFTIYSTSKFITGLAFLKLVQEGRIDDLNKSIHEIDPSLPEHYKGVTVRHLLTHRSGIRHYQGRKDWMSFAALQVNSPREAMDYFIQDPLRSAPGEEESYTTFGMVVASHILEKITGMTYQEALNDLLPFSTPILLDQDSEMKATPYLQKGKKYTVVEGMGAASKYGGGGLIATSQQLAEAGKMLYDGSIAPLDEIKESYKNEYPEEAKYGTAFAMGSGFSSNYGDEPVMYANMGGGSPGGRSYVLVLVDFKVSVALTGNLEGDGEKAYKICIDLAKRFAGID